MMRLLPCLLLTCTLFAQKAAGDADAWKAPPDPETAPIPQWIWGPHDAKSGEVENFRITFDAKLPTTHMTEDPSSAFLWCAGDDDMTVWINGKSVAEAHTGSAVIVDVRSVLAPGKNIINVRCKNNSGPAGVAVKLVVRGQYREPFFLVTDGTWKCSADAPKGWRGKNFDDAKFALARVLGPYGMAPWRKLKVEPMTVAATAADQLTLLPGFKAELLYSVPKGSQGSWVSMAADPEGRLYVSDQSGPLYRVTPGKDADDTKVEKVDLDIGSAQGLLWAFNGLYVVVNGSNHGHESGLYRLTDTNGDDKLDKIEPLVMYMDRAGTGPAGGEHGPHAVVLGPDNKLYVVAGNFTGLPKPLLPTSPAAHWAEDLLLPREPDGRGHDPGLMAPGGCVCRMDPDGKNIEVFCIGLRNSYDIAFDPDGELFTYDSDMEWDIGAPWYRPTRICHLVSGAEFGWRNGSGKFPNYYPDSIPPVVDIGLGSPTGLTFGTGAKFPAKYQHAFFANDWAYGKIYAVHFTPRGASYSATFEPFVIGKPFDVTDIVINHDGAMYVIMGGRNTQSGLYRITYTGPESTAPSAYPEDPEAVAAREIRHHLEAFHGHRDEKAVDFAWPYLNSDDRFLRYAARIAIEFQPVKQWQKRALDETQPTAAINGLLALCRLGDKSLQPKILAALDRIDSETLSSDQVLELLRAYEVCFARMGRPDAATLARMHSRADAAFPTDNKEINHELAQLLVYCGSPTIVTKCMNLLAAADTQEEQMFYAFVIRYVETGWTLPQRQAYFKWFNMAKEKYTGGASFQLFLDHIRDEAVMTLTPQEHAALADVLKGPEVAAPVAPGGKPRAFVRNWKMEDLAPKLDEVKHGRSFASGKAAFDAVSCIQCHRFNGKGNGSLGPDITGVGSRFNANDILESIILPSKVISDQYADTKVVTRDRGAVVGSIQSEDANQILIRTNPFSTTTQTVLKKDIVRRELSKLSPMPTGLLNILTEDEILDLLAYLQSGGKEEAFKK